MRTIDFVINQEELQSILNIQINKEIILSSVINKVIESNSTFFDLTRLQSLGYNDLYSDIDNYDITRKLKIIKGSRLKEYKKNIFVDLEFINDNDYYSMEDLKNINLNFKVSVEKIKEKEKEVMFYV
jgi:hypothetical protein